MPQITRARALSTSCTYQSFSRCEKISGVRNMLFINENLGVCGLLNNNPKSEMPAMKEKAAKEKDKQARQSSIDKERTSRAKVRDTSRSEKSGR